MGGCKLYTQGQGVFDDRRQVAALSRGRAGGADLRRAGTQRRCLRWQGGHVDPGPDRTAGQVTGRPVKLTLNREESIRLHPKRHPIRMDYTSAATRRDG